MSVLTPVQPPALGLGMAALVGLGAGACTSLAAGLVDGSQAVLAALLGVLVVVGFFGFGAVFLSIVTRIAPAQALLFALLTYLLQVLALAAFFGVIKGDDAVSAAQREWLGVAIIAASLGWSSGQLVGVARAPLQPLSAPGAVTPSTAGPGDPQTRGDLDVNPGGPDSREG